MISRKKLVCSEKLSTTNPSLNAIGRALRTHGDPDKIARVYDFIGEGVSADMARKEWLEELSEIRHLGEK